MKTFVWLSYTLLSFYGTCNLASADIVLYSDRATWAAAVNGPLENLTFATLNTTSSGFGYTDLGVGPVTLGPLTFTGVGQASAPPAEPLFYNNLQAVSVGEDSCRIADCLASTASGTFPDFNESSNMFVRIGFPIDTYAFGVNLDNVDSDPTGDFVITFPGQQINSVTIPIFSSAFFGFTSSTPVAEIDVTEIANVGLGAWLMDSPSVVAPEPSEWLLVSIGLAALVFLKLRRRAIIQ